MKKRTATPFLVLGIVFLALGATGRAPFLALGIVFLVLGVLGARRRAGG